jgi:predicted HAD superfamily Cof-like phosphohydrolase
MNFSFEDAIASFNAMYKLPVAKVPTLDVGVPVRERLQKFKSILKEELDEIDEISLGLENNTELETLTALADLLGDLQVYCASEMCKFGIPQGLTLKIVMDSNASKLGTDGLPIYDERGKVQKGPNYWKPEPALAEMLKAQMPAN